MIKRKLNISRRILLGSGLSAALMAASGAASAKTISGNKLVVIILRGAMDGLAAVPVIGRDAGGEALLRFRPDLIDPAAAPLSEGFALHPALPNVARLIRKGEGRVMHAAAGPYRGRSHFKGQDILESPLRALPRACFRLRAGQILLCSRSRVGTLMRAKLIYLAASLPSLMTRCSLWSKLWAAIGIRHW